MQADVLGEFCEWHAGDVDGDSGDGFDIYRMERAVRRHRHLHGYDHGGDDGDGDI